MAPPGLVGTASRAMPGNPMLTFGKTRCSLRQRPAPNMLLTLGESVDRLALPRRISLATRWLGIVAGALLPRRF